jgi:mRNA deadenylase 3'-5' endonuclease subunit Ccr4
VLPTEKLYSLLTAHHIHDESEYIKYEPSPDTNQPNNTTDATKDVQSTEESSPTVHAMVSKLISYPRFCSAYSVYQKVTTDYETIPGNDWTGEPAFTNYTEFKGTLDYIFTETVEGTNGAGRQVVPCLTRLLKIPSSNFLEPGLPNWNFPSDHIPIVAEYKLG